MPRGILLPCCRNIGLLLIAMMNEDTIAQSEAAARRDRVAAVEFGIVEEHAQAERIDAKQAVASRRPGSRMPEIVKTIENGNANLFAIHLAIVIHPIRLLAPDFLFTCSPV